jgi:gliding motility-associated-like protein
MEGAVIESIADQTFTGSELEPKLTVKDGSETLVEGTDYEVTYSDNINVGTATVTVNGIGNYSGTLTKTFNVVSKSLENAKIGTIGSQLYTGTERKPAVPVTDGSVTLVVGVDYSVSYADNINTGPATVTVTGIGNYKGTLDGNFQIVSKSIENAVVEAIVDQTYTGSELEPKVTLKDGSVTLEEGVDYEVTYTDNIQTGKSTVTIKGIGNYAGTVTTTFEIVSKSMEGAVIESIGDQTFTGSELEPKVTVKDGSETLVEGTDYEVTYSDNINVGTATVTVNGIGNYSGTLTKTFNVVSKSLEIAKIGTIGSQLYTGTERKPAVLVTDGSVTLVVGVDYTVSYTDNINVGTAKVTVTGIGNYKATLDGNFQIVSKSIENAVIEAIVDQTYTGSELEPKVTLKDGSVTLEEGVDYEVTYTDNIQTGKSTVTIKGIGNYAGTVTTTFEIVSKTLEDADIESIGNQTSTGSELEPKVTIKDGSVTLVEGTDYEVTYSDNISVGTATVTVKGIGNYSGTLMGSFKIVSKLLEGSTINAIADLTFAGVALEPALTVKDGTFTLVEGKDYTVSYSDNVNVGTVTVTLTGTGNYGGTLTSSFAILKKAVKITAEDKERNFGEANPMFTLLYEGVVVGATRIAVEPGISTEATATSIPGIYAIVLTGGSDPNYAITLVEGKLTVLNTSISEVRNLEGTVEDKEIGLSWELPEEYFGELSGYRIEISEDGENFKLLAETEALIYNATGLQNTQKYWFRVSAYSEFTVGKEKVIGPLIPLAVDTGENNTVETQEPGEYKFTIDGKEEEIFLDIVEDALVFESGPLKMQLEGNKATGEQLPILNGLLLLVPNGVAEVSGEGFKPNTAVAVWLVQNVDDAPGGRILEEEVYLKTTLTEINSVWKQSSRMMGAQKGEVYFLGYADVDENGRFKARLAIPQDIKPGRYTLQATGITGSGFSMTLNLGAILFEDVDLDTDGDLVPDIYEFIQGTDPNNIQEFQDINGDGVADYVEERSPIEVLKPGAVRSAWGAPINPANLPKQVAVFTGAKELVLLNVDWDYSKVNVDRRGSTIVSGELELKSGMFNGYNLKGSVEVVILPKPAPLDVALNNSVFKAEGKKFFIPVGGFQVNDPVDNIHEVTLQGSGYDNRFFEIKENILFWSSADRVAGKTAFSIMVRVTDRDGNTLDKVFDVQRIRPSMDELKIYNTFTPNGDRINDTWGVPEVRFYEGARIQVFERSGERVFYTEDPDERWDGSYKGKELPVGTYYWVLEIKETGHTRRGLLNLIRQ